MDLITRQVIRELEGDREDVDLEPYADPESEQYRAMIERIRQKAELHLPAVPPAGRHDRFRGHRPL